MEQTNHKILTIPNLLSAFRILLIPVIAYLYCVKGRSDLTFYVLLLSGATDIVDGFIARRFHMISDLGKALDPIADKLTQAVVILCLAFTYPAMAVLLVILLVKELIMGILGLVVLKKTGSVHGAKWHGKLTTCLIDTAMAAHILCSSMPSAVSYGLIGLCIASIAASLILYTIGYQALLTEAKTK